MYRRSGSVDEADLQGLIRRLRHFHKLLTNCQLGLVRTGGDLRAISK